MVSLIFLALVQSLTEFLPISSSGHLLLASLSGLSHQSIGVDVALHVGTLLAVIIYFWRDIWDMMSLRNLRLMMQLFVATLPVIVLGLIIHYFHLPLLRGAIIVGICSIFFGWLLWRVDDKYPCHRKIDQMEYKDAFLIGLAQILALIPGTSRSGITMTCARWRGFKREESARFSMLLSIPTIALAGMYTTWQALEGKIELPAPTDLGVSMIAAALFGLMAIAFLMKWVQKASFFVFALYRIILGIVVIWCFW
ncbi:MAG: undecaprenyl-diphosphate phosphatase [Alphaproteobacteria bacterium]|nr:undecaprenyl-diphosphate phosphatase [Alphaproteobacteria bacterium]